MKFVLNKKTPRDYLGVTSLKVKTIDFPILNLAKFTVQLYRSLTLQTSTPYSLAKFTVHNLVKFTVQILSKIRLFLKVKKEKKFREAKDRGNRNGKKGDFDVTSITAGA